MSGSVLFMLLHLIHIHQCFKPQRAEDEYQVFQVNATDADAGRNGEIFYSLEDASLPFRISSMQGVITVNGPLDYEEQNEYIVRSYICSAVYCQVVAPVKFPWLHVYLGLTRSFCG